MSISVNVNGKSQVPPGFRFHPTEEELLQYYLRKKVSHEKIDLDVINDVDLNKLEPWDIQDKCKIGSTPQNDWYFFSHKDKKYPTGTRTNRATAAGFWKATGRDKVIHSNGNRIGMRKTLVFYKGRAPHGQKSDWIMHEYRLDDNNTSETTITTVSNSNNVMGGDAGQEEGWVVCRIFKKKNHLKTLDSPLKSSPISTTGGEITRRSHLVDSCDVEALEQILQNNIGNGSRAGFDNGCYHDRFMKLPSLDSPAPKSTSMVSQQNINNNNNNGHGYHPINTPVEMVTVTDKRGSFTTTTTTLTHLQVNGAEADTNTVHPMEATSSMGVAVGSGGCLTNWAALDRLVASQLNGQIETWKQLPYFNDPINTNTSLSYCTSHHDLQLPSLRSSTHDYTTEIDLWHFAPSTSSLSFPTSEPLCHVCNSSL